MRESLVLSRRIEDRQGTMLGAFRSLAVVLAGRGRRRTGAGILWGAVEAEAREGSYRAMEACRPTSIDVSAGVAGPAFAGGVAEGRTLPLESERWSSRSAT